MLDDFFSRRPEHSFCESYRTQSDKRVVKLKSTAVRMEFLTDKQLRRIVELANECELSVKQWLLTMRHDTTQYKLEEGEEIIYIPSGLITGCIRKSPTYSFIGGIDFDGSVHS